MKIILFILINLDLNAKYIFYIGPNISKQFTQDQNQPKYLFKNFLCGWFNMIYKGSSHCDSK